MISWEQAKEIIQKHRLEELTRSKEQIEKYRAAKEQFERSHGSIAQFILEERLKWKGLAAKASGDKLLENWHDIKIIPNDFSYDFEHGVRHFVIWLKTPIPCDENEIPTDESKRRIEEFLHTHFGGRAGVPMHDVMWFKNTKGLQSVPSLEHFHVLVRGCTDKLEEKILSLNK